MRFAIAISLLLSSASAFAFEAKLGLSAATFDYREDLPSPAKSRETGWIPYLELGGRWTPASWGGSAFSLDWTSTYNTQTTYLGTDFNTHQGVTDRDSHTFHRLEGVFEIAATETTTVYFGLSYDRWDRFLAYGTGYREIYEWWTLPVGIRFPIVSHRGSWWLLDLAIRPMVSGSMRAIFSETFPDGDDSNLTLGNEIGWRIRLPYEFYGDGWRFDIGPWFETYRFGQSPAVYNSTPGIAGYVREPASQTVKTGLTAQMIFLF